jgi:hypothetical protein
MITIKHIYWRTDAEINEQGEVLANVHLLDDQGDTSLTALSKMADELRKTFPQAQDDKICAGTVTVSFLLKGFAIITWEGRIKKAEYLGWEQHYNAIPAYR